MGITLGCVIALGVIVPLYDRLGVSGRADDGHGPPQDVSAGLSGATIALLEAVDAEDWSRADEAIARGADLECEIGGRPVLFTWVRKGELSKVEFMLSRGARVDSITSIGGRSPLHEAALYGYLDMAQLLIEHGADVNARNKRGETPLFYAEGGMIAGPRVTEQHGAVARLLRDHGAIEYRSPAVPPGGEWLTYSPPDSSFTIEFPADPAVTETALTVMGVEITAHTVRATAGETIVAIVYADYPASLLAGVDAGKLLDGGIQGWLGEIGGTLLSAQDLQHEGHPGRHAVARFRLREGVDGVCTVNAFLVGHRIYQLQCIGRQGEVDNSVRARFFGAFQAHP